MYEAPTTRIFVAQIKFSASFYNSILSAFFPNLKKEAFQYPILIQIKKVYYHTRTNISICMQYYQIKKDEISFYIGTVILILQIKIIHYRYCTMRIPYYLHNITPVPCFIKDESANKNSMLVYYSSDSDFVLYISSSCFNFVTPKNKTQNKNPM